MNKPPKTVKSIDPENMLRGRAALRDICERTVQLGKTEQTKSPFVDPNSPYYDKKIAKRRAKEKARRKFNATHR